MKNEHEDLMSSHFVNQFIVGTLLGDSYISRTGQYGFGHSQKQLDYFHHKVSILRENGYKVNTYTYNTKGQQIGRWFIPPTPVIKATCSKIAKWKPLRTLWYPDGNKIVPRNIEITPITLAYWFMDDGSVNKRTKFVDSRPGRHTRSGGPWVNQFRLHVDGFDTQSQELLQQRLRDNLGIESWFYTKKSNQKRHMIISKLESKRRFKDLLYPIITNAVPSMQYKIDYEVSFTLREQAKGDSAPESCGAPFLHDQQV